MLLTANVTFQNWSPGSWCSLMPGTFKLGISRLHVWLVQCPGGMRFCNWPAGEQGPSRSRLLNRDRMRNFALVPLRKAQFALTTRV